MALVTDIDQLSAAIGHATAPAFMLGAAAAFLSILIARLERVADKSRAPRSPDAATVDPSGAIAASFSRRMVLLSRAQRSHHRRAADVRICRRSKRHRPCPAHRLGVRCVTGATDGLASRVDPRDSRLHGEHASRMIAAGSPVLISRAALENSAFCGGYGRTAPGGSSGRRAESAQPRFKPERGDRTCNGRRE